MKKILVLLAHPDKASLCGAFADTYEESARRAGFDVKRFNIDTMSFDPVLHKGHKVDQPLEADLAVFTDVWSASDHIVIIYPNWWSSMPAKLKGLFDRIWLPGFAYDGNEKGHTIPRFKGKTARVIVASGMHSPLVSWWRFGDFTNEITHGILGFSGMSAHSTVFGPALHVSDATRVKWLKKIEKLGAKGI